MNMIDTPYQRFMLFAKTSSYFLLMFVLFWQCQPKGTPSSNLFRQTTSQESGVDFINRLPSNHMMNNMVYDYYYNGGGVAVGDINNDNLPDLFFTANLLPDRLYLNKGDLQFDDITEQAGIAHSKSWSTGTAMIDINADGWLDIYVCKSGRLSEEKRANQLFVNQQDGTFKEQAAGYGLNSSSYSTQIAFLDFDLDGDLDAYLLNHPIEKTTVQDFKEVRNITHPLGGDQLFENRNGKYVDIGQKVGIIGNPLSFGLGVAVGDLNADGWPDLFVTNDYSEPDYLYYNQKDGTFNEVIKEKTSQISNFSMGNDIADFSNDGYLDLVTAEMSPEDNYSIKTSMSGMNPEQFYRLVDNDMHHQYMYNTLQVNAGNGHFSEIGQLAQIANTGWSWTTLFADFDLDGYKDLFISNGYKADNSNNDFKIWYKKALKEFESRSSGDTIAFMNEVINRIPQVHIPNYLFRNTGNHQFENSTEKWGLANASFSTGAAYADLDNDGDLDLVINNVDEQSQVYENQSTQKNYLKIRLLGAEKNPLGIGAKVEVQAAGQSQYQEQYLTRGYQSSVTSELIFGLGSADRIDQVRVIWPDGKTSRLENVRANQTLKVLYAEAKNNKLVRLASLKKSDTSVSKFKDVTSEFKLAHQHIENQYDDFEKESLLPHRMSQFGPALATGDVNGDGLEDFYVGGAKGLHGSVYLQQSDGSFKKRVSKLWEREKEFEDLDADLFDADGDQDLDLYVVSGGSEFEANSPWLQDRLYINDGNGNFSKSTRLPNNFISGSKVKPYDFDRDGDLDLFVGGRLVPGQYPLPTKSILLRNEGGRFADITEDTCPELLEIGMVTDAVWTDFNHDGESDLILVGEWMAPRFFSGANGQWEEIKNTGILDQTGWWFSIEQADFDQDGDMDYVVGNLGLNYKYKASQSAPFSVYTKDFDESGNLDIVLGYYNNGEEFPLRGRQCSSNQMPFIKKKFPTYHDFGSATIEEVYGSESLEGSTHYAATNFASSYIENLGNGQFAMKVLPIEAQFSSVNDFVVRDFNQDGNLDVVLAGNLYQSEVETPRNDAGYGLLLLGDGHGNFKTQPFSESGLFIKGDTKVIKTIEVGNAKSMLVGKNQDFLQLIQW
ncbi:FG-GAP-like repeat-containing protein [Reichenbachiella sp.]|uniref:FG-GAP-like repeat-containing protein n=1 Tax=Reichenbachiella sp. TaxID=2184521 RepID=UPI003BAE2E7C